MTLSQHTRSSRQAGRPCSTLALLPMPTRLLVALSRLAFLLLLAYALGGRWRTPYERAGVLGAQNRIILLALLSVLWVSAEWAVAQLPLPLEASALLFAREAADWGRQAAACALLMHLLSPNEPLRATERGRKIAVACTGVLVLGAVGAVLHAL